MLISHLLISSSCVYVYVLLRLFIPYGDSFNAKMCTLSAQTCVTLRKLPRQAKICTPPGGAMVAKICKR